MSRSLSYQFEKPKPKPEPVEGSEDSSSLREDPVTIVFNDAEKPIACIDEIDGLVALQFAAAFQPGTNGNERARGILKVLKAAIQPHEWNRFEALVAEYKLEVDNLIDISNDLVDNYLSHPTAPLPTSSGGQRESGTGSEGNSSSEESSGTN